MGVVVQQQLLCEPARNDSCGPAWSACIFPEHVQQMLSRNRHVRVHVTWGNRSRDVPFVGRFQAIDRAFKKK